MCPRISDDTLKDEPAPPSATRPAGLVTGPFVLPPEAVAPTSTRYAELGVLGEGGMGKVHLCRDARIGREVAMKVILPDLQANTSTRARVRRIALGVVLTALVGSVLVELSGFFPRTYSVSPAALLISPSAGARDLPLTALLLLMNVTAMVTTALTVAGVRAQLTRAEERLLLHAWQVRGMMPSNVGDRSSERGAPNRSRSGENR